MNDGETRRPRHEERDLSVRWIAAFGVLLVLFGAAAHVLLAALFSKYGERADRRGISTTAIEREKVAPPTPRLQENPGQDLRALREQEEREMSGYGWVDRESGTVRIPIDRAMRLVVERGLPTRSQPGPGQEEREGR